jgi:hypothetical protein
MVAISLMVGVGFSKERDRFFDRVETSTVGCDRDVIIGRGTGQRDAFLPFLDRPGLGDRFRRDVRSNRCAVGLVHNARLPAGPPVRATWIGFVNVADIVLLGRSFTMAVMARAGRSK